MPPFKINLSTYFESDNLYIVLSIPYETSKSCNVLFDAIANFFNLSLIDVVLTIIRPPNMILVLYHILKLQRIELFY